MTPHTLFHPTRVATQAAPVPANVDSDEAVPYRWLILLGLITAAIMEVLDTTIINVALPQMAGNLGATNEEIAWVSTSYILANVVVLPMTAFFTARFGRRNYLTFSILLFIIASFLCGTSHSLSELVVWRLLQGAGGAALLSTAQATLRQIFPREQQGMVQAIFLLGIIVAPTLGPTLGGWITDNYTWNWCFFINIPIGIASAFLVTTFLHDPPGARRIDPVDWLGIGLLIVGVGALQYVLEEGNRKDWFDDRADRRASRSLSAHFARRHGVVGAVIAEQAPGDQLPRAAQPRSVRVDLPVRGARLRSVRRHVSLPALHAGNARLHADRDRAHDAARRARDGGDGGGLRPAAQRQEAAGRRALPDHPRRDGVQLLRCGCSAISRRQRARAMRAVALIMRGAALGLLFTPINNAAFGSLKPSEAQQASGLINLSRQLGGSFGIAVLSTYLTRHVQYHRADLVANFFAGNPAFDQRYAGAVASSSRTAARSCRRRRARSRCST